MIFDEVAVVVLVDDVLFVWAGEETCNGGDEEEVVDMLFLKWSFFSF